jgi:DNA primase
MPDFKEVRAAVPIEKAATFLGIELKKEKDHYRCYCPHCEKDRVLIITPSRGVFYCHNEKRGGDVSDLTAHVKGITQVQALKLLADTFLKQPEKPKRKSRAKPKPTPSVYTPEEIAEQADIHWRRKNGPPPPTSGAGGIEEMEMWEAFISRL